MATKTNTEINGRDYFRIRRTIDGVQKNFYGTSKGDAERKYREYVEESIRRRNEKKRLSDRATFRERADEYVENVLMVSQKYATGTKMRYSGYYNVHVRDSEIADIRISDIRASDVQKFYNGLNVSVSTMKGIAKFMSVFLKWCQLNGYCDHVLQAVEIPKKKDTTKHNGIITWDEDEVVHILGSLDRAESHTDSFRATFFVYVLLYTGMRFSEALGLRYSDFGKDTITVSRQYYLGEIKPPKYNSVREIPIHEKLRPAFARHKAWHEKEMKRNGYKTDYVFTTRTGSLYESANIRRALTRFYNRWGIPHKNIHAYRSTFCTQLCRCGVPLEVASSLLGHKSLEVTAAHYALIKKDTKQDAIARLHY